ncbi:hypothetical protein [Aliarcobacter butzleri]|uniref:hypothetical protein n=1 Tax=Aliarcobacter butzleri TaxID=28197 RepID=UPI00125F74D7|nr:hypothetical protein [Aliarcobacter butzleri]
MPCPIKTKQNILLDRLKEDFKAIGTLLLSRDAKKIDKSVDTIRNDFFNILELASLGIKFPAGKMAEKDFTKINWFTISENTRQANEIINNFRIIKGNIYESAGDIKQGLETLSKDDNKNLVKALNGDMSPDELNPVTKKLHDSFRSIIDKNADRLIEAGILDEKDKIDSYLKRYYSQYVDENAPKTGGSVAFNKLKQRKDLTYDERITLGMIEDATFVIPNTIAEQNILLEKAKILKTLADSFGHDDEIAGYVKISDESAKSGLKRYGALAGKWVHPDIKKELDYARIVQRETNWVETWLYPTIDHLKVNMTVKNPVTHVYNIASNMLLAGLNGDMLSLGKVLYLRHKNPNKFKELVKKANTMGLNSYLDDFEKSHIDLAPNGRVNVAQTIWKNLYMTRDSKLGKGMRYLYDWEDKIFKIASFYKGLEDGLDAKTAFDNAKEVYVDYSTPLPAAIRVLDKTGAMPFLHYQYKSTPAILKVMGKNKLRTLLLGTGVFALGGSVFQDEEQEYYKPEWAGNKFNLFATKEWLRLGNGWYLNAGRMIPGTKFEFELGGIPKGVFEIVNGKTPLGYNIGSKYDSDLESYGQRALAMAENYLPSATLGRYAQRAVNIGLGNLGITEPKKNYYQEDMTVKELGGRALGIRRFNEQKELDSKMNDAKKEFKYRVKENPKSKSEEEKKYNDKAKKISDASRKIKKDTKILPLGNKDKDFNFDAKFKF